MKEDIDNAVKVLREGGVILYPTDTIWGIGCDATNQHAVERIYEIKERSDEKSMIILVDTENRILSYVSTMPEVAWDLVEVSEKPLTIIYPGAKNLAENLIAPDRSIGIRVTRDSFCIKLISRLKKPIVSTSANISGEKPPANFHEINTLIMNKVDYVVKYRQDDVSRSSPSGIIKLGTGGEVKIIRE